MKCEDCEYYTPISKTEGTCDGSMSPWPVTVKAQDWPCSHFEKRD